MTALNMSRWAQRHGIPRRPPGLASTAANLNATEDANRPRHYCGQPSTESAAPHG